jgi:outer membrane protein TolC
MKLTHFLAFSVFVFSMSTLASTITIDENSLLEISKNTSVPQLEEIKATMLQAKSQSGEANDALGVEAYGGYNNTRTKERPIINFIPVFSPIIQYQVGIKKNFKYGLQANLYTTVDSRGSEDGRFKSIYTTTQALELNLDLWKDIFGKVTRRKLDNVELVTKQSKIQADINEKVFRLTLRRIYWSLVANQEKINISKNLYKTALRQAKDARKRKANSIADASEVARYESQVAARNGSVLLLGFEKENILKQLRTMLPDLSTKEITLGEYSLNKTLFEVLACTSLIDKANSVPYKYTQYDELTNLLKTVQKNQEKIDDTYDSIDLTLSTTFQRRGVGSNVSGNVNGNDTFSGSYSDSLDDMNNNNREGTSTGIKLTIPLGKKFSDTNSVKTEYNKRRMKASIANVETNLVATHRQISKTIKILSDVIKAQKVNSKQLSIRLKEMNKKYAQARIPVYALVQDQDQLLSSDLSIVDTQLAILNTLLDYFVVFSETPCDFNKL